MTLFGREAHFPIGFTEWSQLIAILAIIAVAMRFASGWSTALLGASAGFASYLYDHHLFIPVVIALSSVLALALGVRAGSAPAGWRAGKEVILLAAGFLAYEWGRSLVIGSFERADANAQRIMDFERRLGLAIEEPIQQWVVRHPSLVSVYSGGVHGPYEYVVMERIRDGDPRPVAILVTDWMREHLYLYARELWHRPARRRK